MEAKEKRYKHISQEILKYIGGEENIIGVAHCATRLRIVLEDNEKAELKKIEDIDLVKGVFIAGINCRSFLEQGWSIISMPCSPN